MTTPKDSERGKDFELHLPAGTADKFQAAVASIPADKRVWWRYHKVQAGETLAAIARTYHTTPRAISEANDLNGDGLSPEARLIIPIAPGKQSDTSTYAHAITRYKVRKGDTVESVAENFGVSAKMVRSWNHLKGSSLAGRKVLYVHLPVAPGAGSAQVASKSSSGAHHHDRAVTRVASGGGTAKVASSKASTGVVRHKVKPGETLYSIANSYNTTVNALKHDNRDIAVLRPGMILVVHNLR
jgi:LysM repeat protein